MRSTCHLLDLSNPSQDITNHTIPVCYLHRPSSCTKGNDSQAKWSWLQDKSHLGKQQLKARFNLENLLHKCWWVMTWYLEVPTSHAFFPTPKPYIIFSAVPARARALKKSKLFSEHVIKSHLFSLPFLLLSAISSHQRKHHGS